MVGVLILVDEHVREGARVALAHLLEQLEHVDRAQQQVVEVHRVHPQQFALIEVIDVGDELLVLRADRLAVVLGDDQAVLGGRDLALHRGRRKTLGVDAQLVDAAPRQPARVGLVVDRELAGVAKALGLGAQDARARRVEGHQPHPARRAAEQLLHATAHLLGGLVGERDREDLARLGLVGEDQIRHAVGEHARLAAARAGQDEQRSLAVGDGLSLWLVETLQELLEMRGVRVGGHQIQHRCAPGQRIGLLAR